MLKARGIAGPDSAIRLYKEVIQMSLALHWEDSIFTAYCKLAERYAQNSEYEKGLECIRQAAPFCRSALDSVLFFSRIGGNCLFMGDYVQASQNYHMALEHIRETKEFLPRRASINVNLGFVAMRTRENEKALDYFTKAEIIARNEKLNNVLATVLIDKGELLIELNRTDSARHCFTELMIIGEHTGRPDYIAYAHEGLGIMSINTEQYQNATEHLQQAIEIAKKNGNENIVIDASYHLGDALYHLGNFKDAEQVLLFALKEAGIRKMKEKTVNGYTTLIKIYKTTKQYKKAIGYMDSLATLKDSLVNSEKMRVIHEIDTKYNIAEKDRLLARSNLQIAEQKSNIARKNMWMLSIGSGVLLLFVVAIAIYRNSIHKIKVLEQENKIGTLKAAVEGQDSERARIARELHDGIGGMLSAATMRFSAVEMGTFGIEQRDAYLHAMTLLDGIGNELRQAAHNLMPDQLLQQNLPEALQTYCRNIQSEAIDISFQSYGDLSILNEGLKLNVYRIVQELLNNICHHANATRVLVQLQRVDAILVITVEDNGIGFDPTEAHTGIGLNNIRSRVKIFDGRMVIDSQKAKGTTIFIEFDV